MASSTSILDTVKSYLNIYPEDVEFDADIIMLINGNLFVINQLGIGTENYQIVDKSNTWDEFVDIAKYSAVRTWMSLKVKQAFDPSSNTTILNAQKELLNEYEWRLREQVRITEVTP